MLNFLCRYWQRCCIGMVFSCASLPAIPASDALPVNTETARIKPVIETVTLTGTVVARRISQISTAVPGQVENMAVNIGDHVDAGSLLLSLDDEIATEELRSGRAAAREARAELDDAKRRLAEANRLSQQQSIAETQVRTLDAEVSIDQAALERLEAEAARRASRLERHVLNAPFSGVVSQKFTEVGEWVTPGNAVIELVAMDELLIDFQVSQNYYPRVNKESQIQVMLDALPDRTINTRVDAVVPVSDPDARTFTLRLEPLDAVSEMTPGMSARGVLRIQTNERGVVVPRDALIRYPDGRITVWVVKEKGEGGFTVSERRVQTGLSFDGQVHILDGVDSGMELITQGNETLQEGQTVRIRENRGN